MEDLPPVLLEEMPILRAEGFLPAHNDQIGPGGIGAHLRVKDAVGGRFCSQHHGAGAVTEEDAGRPVPIIG